MQKPHYNAFISYRHVPRDIRVAAEIQKRLEHYRVPAAIRRQTGRKGIERVFRDSEELPVTSDLQENIAQALENSEYLIVICSPDTKSSIWVQREIEFFLRTHSRDYVLTVLSAGNDPGEIIPDILLYDEKDGQRVPREPLSCDYRGNIRQARREELPRLASVLLGCSYDDLRQRQRQYRTRRIMAVLSFAMAVLAVSAGYLLWSGQQIRENLRQSQINESRFLANAAMDEYRDGNRVLAARLALEALPSDEDPDRPVSAEALKALSKALYAYQTPGDMNVGTVRVFDTNAGVKKLLADSDRRRLLALDDTGTVHIWSIDSGEELLTIPSGGNAWSDFLLGADGEIVLISDRKCRACDGESGKELWEREADMNLFSLSEFRGVCPYAMSADGSRFFMQEPSFWSSDENKLLALDTATGEEILSWDLRVTGNAASDEEEYWYVEGIAVSETDGSVAVAETTTDGKVRILTAEGDGGEFREIRPALQEIYTMIFDLRGQLLLCGLPADADTESALPDMWLLGDYVTISGRYAAETVCYDREGQKIWSRDMQAAMAGPVRTMFSGSFRLSGADEEQDSDVCVLGSAVLFLDPDDGTEQSSYILPSAAAAAEICYPSVRVVLRSGDLTYLYCGGDKAYLNRYFSENTEGAAFTGGYLANDRDAAVFTLSAGKREILMYQGGIGDENYQLFDAGAAAETLEDASVYRTKTAGDLGVSLTVSGSDDQLAVYVLDLAEKRVSKLADLPGSYYDYTWEDLSEDTGILTLLYEEDLWINQTPARCIQVSLPDGKLTDTEIPVPADDNRNLTLRDSVFSGGSLFLLTDSIEEDTVWQFRPDTGELTEVFSEGMEDYNSPGISFVRASRDGNHLLLIYESGECVTADLETGETHYLEMDLFRGNVPFSGEQVLFDWDEEEDRFILSAPDAEVICLADADGTVLMTVPFAGKSPHSVCIRDQKVWVLFGDASLESYSMDDGAFLERIELLSDGSQIYLYDYSWDWDESGELRLLGSSHMYVVDTAAGICSAHLEGCLGYSDRQRLFLMYMDTNDTAAPYAWYSRYSTEDLIRLGHEMTDGQPISQDDRVKYALTED